MQNLYTLLSCLKTAEIQNIQLKAALPYFCSTAYSRKLLAMKLFQTELCTALHRSRPLQAVLRDCPVL